MDTPKSESVKPATDAAGSTATTVIEEVPAAEVEEARAALKSQGISEPTTLQIQSYLESHSSEAPNEQMVPQEIVQ